MTNKPEVVAWMTDDETMHFDTKAEAAAYCEEDEPVALIRLTDHEADRAADKARIAALELLLSDAAQEIEDWGAYAPEYFQEKHDLAGVVARFRAALSQPKEDA